MTLIAAGVGFLVFVKEGKNHLAGHTARSDDAFTNSKAARCFAIISAA